MPQVTQFPEITRLTSGDKLYIIDNGSSSAQITAGNADQSLSKNKIVNVNSINELVNLDVSSIPDNSRVYVKSYYADYSDDGLGGGEFYWNSTSSANGDSGRYIRPNSNPSNGRWERLLNGSIPNVMMWGAKGYKSAASVYVPPFSAPDDTIPINLALSGSYFGWSSKLYFPSRNYKITDTLIWNAQQTHIIGDGCVNGSRIIMDTGIAKDMIVSTIYKGINDHNNNPSESTEPYSPYQGDIPKIEKMAFYHGGAYHRNLITSDVPLQNTTNSILTFVLPGETNLIDNVYFEGGKHALRIIGPQGPGLRITNSTINGQGESAISLEALVYKGSPSPAWELVTGEGAGYITIDNCSTDYRGSNITGYSFIKVHKGAYPQISIKDLKAEGMFPSGIVNYERPSVIDASLGSIKIDGLYWLQTESDANLRKMAIVCLTPGSNSIINSIYVNLKNLSLYGVDELIRDHILKNDQNKPFIAHPLIGRGGGLDQSQCVLSPYTHFGQTSSRFPINEAYRTTPFILNNQPDELMVSFEPSGNTGWYRIMEGNLSHSAALNYNLSISNFYEVHKLNVFSDILNQTADIRSSSSKTNGYNIVTKARLFHSNHPISGTSVYPVFFDIFINETGLQTFYPNFKESASVRVHLERMNSPHGNYSNVSNLIVPIFLGTSGVPYESATAKYHEVDLTRQHDRSQTNQIGAQSIGSTLLQKDLHLFVNSNRDIRLFDAGATVTFAGGGASVNAQGKPIFTNGKLTNIVLTNTGAGYTSFPTITISPVTVGNGSAAFASGQFSPNGGLIRVHVISGGGGYTSGPTFDSAGYSLTGIQDGSILTSKISDSAITTAKIADLNVTYSKIASSAVSGSNIADSGISNSKLLDSIITTNKINNGAITYNKLDTGIFPLIFKDSVSSSVRRLIIQNHSSSPNDTIRIQADEIVLKNNSGLSYLTNSPVIDLKISTAGLGGLDNGSEGSNRWYGIWGIYNSGSNLTSGVLSRADGRNFNYQGTSSSDATWGYGPVMPGTYTYKALLGHVYNNSSSNFDTFFTQDRRTYINDTILFSSKAPNAQNTYQFYQTGLGDNSINLTGLIPKNSIKLCGNIGGNDGYGLIAIAGTSGGLGANVSMSYYGAGGYISTTGSVATWVAASSYEIPLTGQGFWWKGTFGDLGARNVISVNGYEI